MSISYYFIIGYLGYRVLVWVVFKYRFNSWIRVEGDCGEYYLVNFIYRFFLCVKCFKCS